MDVKQIFEKYVFGRIIPEVETVLATAKETRDQGNIPYGQVLCTLGLLTHTEFVGNLYPESRQDESYNEHFNRHFWEMGSGYQELLNNGYDIYGDLRNGMVHAYFPNVPITLILFSDTDTSFDVFGIPIERSTLSTGVGVAKNEHYYFVIDRYLEDFKSACRRLYTKYQKPSPPTFPIHMSFLDGWVSS